MTIGRIPSVEGGIQPTIFDAKADILTATAADTPARLAVGANNTVLTADSTTATGLKWATPSSGSTYVGASAYNSSDQSLSNATYTLVTFNSENFDTNSFHNNSTDTSRMTIPSGKDGKYLVTGQLLFSTSGTGIRVCELRKNGSLVTYIQIEPSDIDYSSLLINWVVDCVATDYLEVKAYQDSGTTRSLIGGNGGTTLQVSYLGA
jgi:hypothetical protein